MTRWNPAWWISEQRWWYIERPFPWPLLVAAAVVLGMLAWVLW